MTCSDFCDILEAPLKLIERLGIPPFQVVRLSLSGVSKHSELMVCLLQVVPNEAWDELEPCLVHPVLYESLSQASLRWMTEKHSHLDSIRLGPLPLPSFRSNHLATELTQPSRWSIVQVETDTTLEHSTVHLNCIYLDPEVELSETALEHALEGQWIQKGTMKLLFLEYGNVIVTIQDIFSSSAPVKDAVAYRLGDQHTVQLHYRPVSTVRRYEPSGDRLEESCPGYEALLQECCELLRIQGKASPSGLLLEGCVGIGKTRLARAVAGELGKHGWNILYISAQELLLQAGWADEPKMLGSFQSPNSGCRTLVIVDDLDILARESSDNDLDVERRLVRNVLMRALDERDTETVKMVGIAQNASGLPHELTKVGCFEKVLEMVPPTQKQREDILFHMLQEALCDPATSIQWAELLSPMTAGYVAADIQHIVVNAATAAAATSDALVKAPSWENLKQAAQSCLPSQIADLDVIKPRLFVDRVQGDDWYRIHELSWSPFAGNEAVKKQVFRTVVLPWRRQLGCEGKQTDDLSNNIAPPSGVLFHGGPGVGKTLAASCLGSSLGLPMIKVRAVDVLDRWLGGSEATLRSLFARSRAAAPCVLFFDEIDAIASNRAVDGETTDVMSRLLSTLLNEMDGICGSLASRVLVVACTNRLSALDAALIRPGRLEEHIELKPPTPADAKDILMLHFGKAVLDHNIDLDVLASELVEKRCTAADLEGLARESVLRSIRRAHTVAVPVSIQDVRSAISALNL